MEDKNELQSNIAASMQPAGKERVNQTPENSTHMTQNQSRQIQKCPDDGVSQNTPFCKKCQKLPQSEASWRREIKVILMPIWTGSHLGLSILVPLLPRHWVAAGYVFIWEFCSLYIVLSIFWLLPLIQQMKMYVPKKVPGPLPVFDRTKHAHVVENMHCYI
ncbi:unnamed protein product [Ranitomeya imitator]|uniref:Uncharacterized protein n=1 Tax=Ranitomeya imitator TaxID=111125 RepID=A0ABN9MQL2_9NEOB|nr:unnamed protein product [Ranitomeya imitator]